MSLHQRAKTRRSQTRHMQNRGLLMETLENRYLLAADFSNIPNPFAVDAVTLEDVARRAETEPFMPGELIVATQVPANKVNANPFLSAIDWAAATGVRSANSIKTLMTVDQGAGKSVALVHLNLGANADLVAAMAQLDEQANFLWSSPNFVYAGADPRDLIPNDPQFGAQYHHTVMNNVSAWDISLGNPNILVGITDDGTDLQHEDLSAAIWQNPGEIAGDGIDNDNNGYIDDVNGYNFLNNNNNPDALAGDDHGTHVSGIVGAAINNNLGTVGTAPGVTILPLKWYDGGTWTAAIIAETFTYAADNGVDIVNTSYNMDSWANDAVVHAAFDYMYDAGVLHFNSAGNGSALNPARQVFVESLLVASTDSNDAKSSFSNYGSGVDIAAPGGSILSTTPNNTYSVFSGTSMASPNAAAVAALIWSAHPTWSREQVAAQLLATADNIDGVNASFIGLLGSGRANSNNALSQVIGAPQISSFAGLPDDGGVLTTPLTGFDVSFSQIMDPTSVNSLSSYELRSAGFDGIFDTPDDDLVMLSLGDTYKIGSNDFHVDIAAGNLGFGEYRLSLIAGGLQNPFTTALDGDGDGVGGDNFVTHFSVEPPAPVAIAPLGSLVYEQSFPNAIDASDDTDMFSVELDEGQTLTVLIEGASGLIPTVTIANPTGTVLADVTGTNQNALAQVLTVGTAGSYLVTVGSDMDTSGAYEVTVLLNAAIETEGVDGNDNDTMSNAQNIDNSSVAFGNFSEVLTADRLAVVGALPSSDGIPVDGDDFESGALDARWTATSSNALGRIQVSNAYGAAGGSFALMMDVSVDNTNNLNEAVWAVDVTGINSPTLSFYHAEWADEENPLPLTFAGSVNGDGVSISEDGVNWHRVYNPTTQTTGAWVKQSIDLTSAAANAGISLNANFRVKFQQYDNFTLVTDGRGYDEIVISEPSTSADWYSFTLDDGASATIGATLVEGSGSVTLELFDSSGSLVATGVPSDNVSSIISQFQGSVAGGGAGTYFARLTGQDATYSLLVTRNADFDTESNDDLATAQDLSGLQAVLGHTSAQTDGGVEPDDYAAGAILNTVAANVTLSNALGGNVFAATASFGAPTGTRVFAPSATAASGWSAGSNELRADFASPTSFVSIDVGSDDSSDVAFLRAYNSSGGLLQEVVSGPIASGGSQTISITRGSADIAYVIAAGVGSDITPLDHLVFGVPGSADVYLISAALGENLNFSASLPAGGPLLFDNPLATPTGSALLMELRDPTGNLVGADSTSIAHTAAQAGDYSLTVSTLDSRGEYIIAINQLNVMSGDFDGDGDYDCDDVDGLVAAIAGNTGDLLYDLSGDGQLTTDDLTLWLAEAGAANLPSGNPYLLGDANLDGLVDGLDFIVWNANKFTPTAAWCDGDFNADGLVDGLDFILWNANKFTSAQLSQPSATKSLEFSVNNQAVSRPLSTAVVARQDLASNRLVDSMPKVRKSQELASRRLADENDQQDERAMAIDALFAQI